MNSKVMFVLGVLCGGLTSSYLTSFILTQATASTPTVCMVETHSRDKKPYTVIVRNGKLKN